MLLDTIVIWAEFVCGGGSWWHGHGPIRITFPLPVRAWQAPLSLVADGEPSQTLSDTAHSSLPWPFAKRLPVDEKGKLERDMADLAYH